MLSQVVGVLLAMAAAALCGARLAKVWETPRLTPLKGALLGPVAAAPTNLLLQLLGGGDLGFTEQGMLDWPPVVATIVAGGLCGIIAVGAVGLVRMGSRRPFG